VNEKNLKIISGGQTGADQAALDVAIRHGIPYGGWVPRGRLTEAGPLPERYRLQEMATERYSERTAKNILDADGTVIISHGRLTGGSALTEKLAKEHGKTLLHLDLEKMSPTYAARLLVGWLAANDITVLNVAGARASMDPEIYPAAVQVLDMALHFRKVKNHA